MKLVFKHAEILLLILVSAVIVFLIFRLNSTNNNQPLTYKTALNSTILWDLVQDWRINNNLQPYTKSQTLCDIAKKRLDDLKFERSISHDGWSKYWHNVPYIDMGENLARVGMSENDTLNSWLKSPSHLENLQRNFKYSCIETAQNDAVQIFANF